MNILKLITQGLSFDDYLVTETKHGKEFIDNLKAIEISTEDCQKTVEGGANYFLCFGEGWCPDTTQQFSLIEKISRSTGISVAYFHSDTFTEELIALSEDGESFIPLILVVDKDGTLLRSCRGRGAKASLWSTEFKAGRLPQDISADEWEKGRAEYMNLYCKDLFQETLTSLSIVNDDVLIEEAMS